MPIDYLLDGDIITEDWIASVAGLVEYGTYTPSLSNITLGTGGSPTNTAGYIYIGGTEADDVGLMYVWGVIVLGTSDEAVSGTPVLTMPPGFEFAFVDNEMQLAGIFRLDPDGGSGTKYVGVPRMTLNATEFALNYLNATADIGSFGGINATTPATWTDNGFIRWNFVAPVKRV